MPTQRPFFSNFLAAFRAHSAIQSKAASSPSSAPNTTQASPSPYSTPSAPRAISTSTSSAPKPSSGATTTALTSLTSPRAHSSSPLSRSPGQASSPASENANAHAQQQGRYITPKTRRGSDSSSEGFRDVLGAEKWYIGGRTATGEERYFKLGVVRRQRSVDRLSLDRLSL